MSVLVLAGCCLLGNSGEFQGTGQLGLGFQVTGQQGPDPATATPGSEFSHNRMSQTGFWVPQPVTISTVVRVSAGFYHTVFVKADGSAHTTGYNSFGQLGLGDETARHEPTAVAAVGALGAGTAASAGYYHTLLAGNGRAWSVGTDESGQLGRGSDSAATDSTVPLPLNQPEVQTAVCTGTGGTFTLSFGGATTTPLAFDANKATVQAAFAALPSVATATLTFSAGSTLSAPAPLPPPARPAAPTP